MSKTPRQHARGWITQALMEYANHVPPSCRDYFIRNADACLDLLDPNVPAASAPDAPPAISGRDAGNGSPGAIAAGGA